MNKRGNIMLGLLFFLMALVVMVMFISPMNEFLDIARQSDNLNCKGYIHDGSKTNVLSFNETSHGNSSGSPLACLSLQLYLPYILLVFLIGGLGLVLGNKAADLIGLGPSQDTGGDY